MDPLAVIAIIVAVVIIVGFILLTLNRRRAPGETITSDLSIFQWLRWHVFSGPTPTAGTSLGTVAAPAARAVDPEASKLEYALTTLSETCEGLAAALDSDDPDERDRRIAAWINIYIESLGTALASGSHQRYRVALWGGYGGVLHGLAWHMFDPNRMPTTLADDSIGALVRRTGEPHYCPDVGRCELYVSHSGRRRTYRSLYAIPLGADDHVWGAITVDAKEVDGVGWVEQAIVLAFGRVVSTGLGILDLDARFAGADDGLE